MSKKRIPDKLKCMYQSAYNDWEGMAERAYAAEARVEAAERRIQELEAAQAWRPVTEPPEDINIEYWTYDRGDIDKMEWTGEHWMMNCTYWYPSHWRPLPPPPTGDNS